MLTFRNRRMHIAGLAGLGITGALLLSDRVDFVSFARGATDVRNDISTLQSTLPAQQGDGSILEEVTFDGRLVTLQFVADERIALNVWRRGDEKARCGMWKKALRSRQVASVEYRYRVGGSISSVFIDRAVCS